MDPLTDDQPRSPRAARVPRVDMALFVLLVSLPLVLLRPMVPEVELRPLVEPVAPLRLEELRLDMLLPAVPVFGLLSTPGFSAVPLFAEPAGPPGVPGGLPAVEPLLMPAEPELELLVCAMTDAPAVANTAASAIAKVFDVIRILDR
jgi:hypothetical protein